MAESKTNYKITGIIGIVIGLICLGSLFSGDNEKLIIRISDFFIVKYAIVISIINVGLFFIIAGIFGCTKKPSAALKGNEAQIRITKAKFTLAGSVLLSPFLLAFFTTIFIMSETLLWKILGSTALLYILWTVISSIRILRKYPKGLTLL